ncbi:galactose-specific lectin nattectin isoform X3 [Fundulus heteroclitus]|uniref:galactose-specific lectin nattectin isoform X3 n=1 Tax=Fundulus heteroclitus TaxID=8078 RepID=UPI00165A2E32|nr:galactose-specific lectin nattectin isoform X3 [Fundulus heteroclitus]
MEILVLSLLHCALLTLGQAVEAIKWTNRTDAQIHPAEEDTAPKVANDQTSGSCSSGWSEFNGRCFRYFPVPRTWASAQKNCVSLQASLASIHNIDEYHEIQRLIMATSKEHKRTWIGGSDAQEEGTWLWSDGSPFHYTNWCAGEPNNGASHPRGIQHCLQMNDKAEKCCDDLWCNDALPFVCAKKICSCAP